MTAQTRALFETLGMTGDTLTQALETLNTICTYTDLSRDQAASIVQRVWASDRLKASDLINLRDAGMNFRPYDKTAIREGHATFNDFHHITTRRTR